MPPLRMKETGDAGFRGLSIINHQRHLPPLDRENAMPFRQELVDVAIEHHLGLLTSWDLYRIQRNNPETKLAKREYKTSFCISMAGLRLSPSTTVSLASLSKRGAINLESS